MQDGRSGLPLRHLQVLFQSGTAVGMGDEQLLDRFARRRDEAAEGAFAALVERHGPMVLRVCREVLRDSHDAQDAFQATFLILARKSASIRSRHSLGPWLHGVALRVSSCARSASARRRAHELRRAQMTIPSLVHQVEGDEGAVLHEEIGRLPEKYRAPVVLCYLEGLTHEQAAEQLRWPVGTVRSRLSGARERLRARLAKRGLAPSALAVDPSTFGDASSAAVPAELVDSTIRSVFLDAAGRVGAGVASSHVASLVQRGMKAMMLNKLKWTVASVLAGGVIAMGAGGLAMRAMGDQPITAKVPGESQEGKVGPSSRGANSTTHGNVQNKISEANGSLPPNANEGELPGEAPAAETVAFGGDAPRTGSEEKPTGFGGFGGVEKGHPRADPGNDPQSLAIKKKLDTTLSLSFPNETPFSDVLAYIKQATAGPNDAKGIPIYVDPVGLQEAEVTLTSPITMDLEGVPLRHTLYLLLAQLGLTYHVEEGILLITSSAPESNRMPSGPSPFMLLKERAERGEMNAQERREFIEMLGDLKEIQVLLHQLENAETLATRKSAQ